MGTLDPAPLTAALTSDAPAQELAWFAIRQPAVIRFLERRLATPDGDALGVALDLACRLHAAIALRDGVPPPRIDDRLLREGGDVEAPAAVAAWVLGQCRAASVVLSDAEEAAVGAALAAIAWGLCAGRGADAAHRWVG